MRKHILPGHTQEITDWESLEISNPFLMRALPYKTFHPLKVQCYKTKGIPFKEDLQKQNTDKF